MQDPYEYMKSASVSPGAYCRYDVSEVHNVEQYLKAVDNCYKKLWHNEIDEDTLQYSSKLWFRGLKSEDYSLLPNIARKPYNAEYETMLLSKFQALALPYLSGIPAYSFLGLADSYWALLFLMQHYGVPTRLMDWSENALVALLFAIDIDASEDELQKNPVVWCLNPIKLNENFNFNDMYPPGYIPNVQEKKVYELFGANENSCEVKTPCAVYGAMNNTKIIAQKGVFTVFPYCKEITPFEKLPNHNNYLQKIIISKDCRQAIIDQLKKYGLTKAQLMPGIASVAMQIKQQEF